MATNLEKYPVVQLLDNLNNPVSPAVQVNSIYEDTGTKNALDLIYKYESETLTTEHLVESDADDGGKTIKQKDTISSKQDGSAPDPSLGPDDAPVVKDLYIVTDTWVGNGPNIEASYEVDNTLHVRKYNASQLLEWWFEHDYLSKQAGKPIYFGTCLDNKKDEEHPLTITNIPGTDSKNNVINSIPRVDLPANRWTIGSVIDFNDVETFGSPIYKVIDFNSTNFFSPDLYPRRGVVRPSGEYIWFVIDSPNVVYQSVKLYGFSGEDSPQEIDIVPINNMANAWRSTGKFGIDANFNTNDEGGDGFDYHIFVKYKEN